MFRAMFSPIIKSISPMLLLAVLRIRNTSQQQHRRTLPEAVVTVICSCDVRKHRPKHVELIKVHKSK